MFHWLKKRLTVGTTCLPLKDHWLEHRLRNLPKGIRILDAGAGQTKYKKFCDHLNYVSQDFGQYDGKGDGEGFHTQVWDNSKLDIVSDITAIPVPDSSFDAILCVEVLEHIPDPNAALQEFFRILKPGGTVLLTAPFCSMTHFAPYFFSTGFSRYWHEHFFSKNGFRIVELAPSGNYFEYIGQEVRRLHRVISQYSTASRLLFYLSKVCALPLVLLLQYLSSHSRNSHELLCFGYFVVATKERL